MNSALTVAIVTRARPNRLAQCLQSLSKQTMKPARVLIIDTDPERSAQVVSQSYQQTLPLDYVTRGNDNVPQARAYALTNATTPYIGFVDDDCILHAAWIREGVRAIRDHTALTYVVGNTTLANPQHVVAQAQHARDSYWKTHHHTREGRSLVHTIDTKNIILSVKALRRHSITFDPQAQIDRFDSADFDLGVQMDRHNLRGSYAPTMKLAHKEPSSLSRYIHRAYIRGRLARYIEQKYHQAFAFIYAPERNVIFWLIRSAIRFTREMHMYTHHLHVSWLRRAYITCMIKVYDRSFIEGYARRI